MLKSAVENVMSQDLMSFACLQYLTKYNITKLSVPTYYY